LAISNQPNRGAKMDNFHILSNRKRTGRLFLLLLCTFYLITCSISTKDLANEDTFIDITVKILTIEKLELPDSIKAILTKNVFSNKNYSIDEYTKTRQKYMQDASHWGNMLAKIKFYMEKKQIFSTKKQRD